MSLSVVSNGSACTLPMFHALAIAPSFSANLIYLLKIGQFIFLADKNL